MSNQTKIKIAYLFCGSGLGALGFGLSKGEHRGVTGTFQNLGGIDNDPLCCKDFEYLNDAPAHCVDLFDRQQYIDFFGHEPPEDWHEFTGEKMRDLFKEYPDVVFLSPPCKGFSGLLSEKNSKSVKYQALNRLTIRSMQLSMDAWGDNPPAFILIENVPRIKSRGGRFLTEIKALLGMYGYVFTESDHDCGEMGGLGQHRRRFMLMARNPKKAPSFLYQPPKQRLKSIGEVIGPLPMPGDIEHGGPLHRIPNLQFKTWLRLAIIPAGGDWRDLNNKCFSNVYKVVPYDKPSHTVTGGTRPNNGAVSVADPRLNYSGRPGTFRLVKWNEPAPTVTGNTGTGRSNSISGVADPRVNEWSGKHSNKYQVEAFDKPSGTIISATDIQSGAISVADPRGSQYGNNYQIDGWNKPSHTVIGSRIGSGAVLVADPRIKSQSRPGLYGVEDWEKPTSTITGTAKVTSGNGIAAVADPRYIGSPRSDVLGVMPWDKPAKTVIGSGNVHAGACAVADPRIPEETESGVWIIVAEDGTWHRPLTTLELAALQGLPLVHKGEPLHMAGNSNAIWREHIGNGVPVQTAQAIGDQIIATLQPNMAGDWHWDLDDNVVWIKGYREIGRVQMQN